MWTFLSFSWAHSHVNLGIQIGCFGCHARLLSQKEVKQNGKAVSTSLSHADTAAQNSTTQKMPNPSDALPFRGYNVPLLCYVFHFHIFVLLYQFFQSESESSQNYKYY